MAVPFPMLKTERLILREIEESDLERIYFFRSDKEITKYIKRPQPQTLKTAQEHIKKIREEQRKNNSANWGIMLHDSNELIGTICLWNFSEDRKKAEVGYDLDTKFHGQGIMSEALKEVLNFGFERMNFETIEAFTENRNIPSKKLLKRFGFIPREGAKDIDNQNNIIFYLNR